MEKLTCSRLRTQLKEIKELKAEFDFELSKIKDTRDTEVALLLETEIKEKLGLIHATILEWQIIETEKIMGKDILGPDAIEVTFGFQPEAKDIPFIPFSKAELERAKELGQFLVLRVDKTSDGQPLTIKAMNELKGGKTKDGGKILYRNDDTGKIKSDAWHKDEEFFKTDTPSLCWALVSKEVIPSSEDKKYLEQTEIIANYLENRVFKNQAMPLEYQAAIDEFKQAKEGIRELILSPDWEAFMEKLASFKINQLFRQTPSEVLYDILLQKEKTGEYLLSNKYTWTSCRASDGGFVDVGRFGVVGAGVYSYTPVFSSSSLGVTFSRRL